MARKLKTYQTSQGFFDLAVAVPSMKAALQAWGANSNLFHQGFAREADDPKTVAAALEKPGTILKRPVGTNDPFREHAELPTNFDLERPQKRPKADDRKRKASPRKVNEKTARAAAITYEKERARREKEQRKQEAAEAKKRMRRERATADARAVLERARREHEATVSSINKQVAAVEKRARAEETRWEKLKRRLEQAAHRARG